MSDRGVCVVTHPLSAAGENATRTLLDILAEVSIVSLITADLPSDSSIRDTYEVVELTAKGAGSNIFVSAVRFLLNQLRMCIVIYDRPEHIILFFGATAYLLPILFARLTGKTVLVEPRGDVPLTLQLNWQQRMPNTLAWLLASSVRLLERGGFVVAHTVVTYTPTMAEELGLDPDSSNIYPHGARYVDTEIFCPRIPFEKRDTVIGFIGRLDEEKGIRKLAEVAKAMPDDVIFRFVGDGPLYDWLEEELAEEIETGKVELVGWVDHDDVPRELNKMKLLVMPSQPTEGLPTTILESLACGTPVYATAVGGVTDVVSDNETGFIMTEQEIETITDEVREIIGNSTLDNISQQGRKQITTEYDFEAAVERYRRLIAINNDNV